MVKIMKYIRLIIYVTLLQFIFTGCSYVSDMVEGAITDRASFSIKAQQVGNDVVITWSETDLSTDFAGIEIYRTRKVNDEYSGYVTVADRFSGSVSGDLNSGYTTTCTVDKPADDGATTPPGTSGIYFYRVGFIQWDEPVGERTTENGYTGTESFDYNYHTGIDAISGSARVEIN
jgi:hypothetical protein